MNKDDVEELFKESLAELDVYANEVRKVKQVIRMVIENIDLVKDDVTDEQIASMSSDVKLKVNRAIAIVKDILADSKELESFINEIKLLKRKRLRRIRQDVSKAEEASINKLLMQTKLNRMKSMFSNTNKKQV